MADQYLTTDGDAAGLVAGRYHVTQPSPSDGDRVDLQVDSHGSLRVGIYGGTAPATVASPSDNASNGNGVLFSGAENFLFNGSTWDRARTPNVFKSLSGLTLSSETTIWTPTSGKKFRLMGMIVSLNTASGRLTFKDNTAGTTIFVLNVNTSGQPVATPPLGNGILSAAANNVLTVTSSQITSVLDAVVFGTEE